MTGAIDCAGNANDADAAAARPGGNRNDRISRRSVDHRARVYVRASSAQNDHAMPEDDPLTRYGPPLAGVILAVVLSVLVAAMVAGQIEGAYQKRALVYAGFVLWVLLGAAVVFVIAHRGEAGRLSISRVSAMGREHLAVAAVSAAAAWPKQRRLARPLRVCDLLRHVPLLRNRQDVVGQPVQHQAGREEEEHHAEDQRHQHHHARLHRIGRRRIQFVLNPHRPHHQQRQDEPRVRRRQIL